MVHLRPSLCWGAVVLIPLALFTAPLAQAQQSNIEVASRHFEEGVVYFQQNDFERALLSFRAAYQASPRSGVLYNMAQCLIGLNKRPEAIRLLEQFLTEQPNTTRREEILRMIEDLRQQPQAPRAAPRESTL